MGTPTRAHSLLLTCFSVERFPLVGPDVKVTGGLCKQTSSHEVAGPGPEAKLGPALVTGLTISAPPIWINQVFA